MYSRKDYKAIADALASLVDELRVNYQLVSYSSNEARIMRGQAILLRDAIDSLCEALRLNNPRFDRDRFKYASHYDQLNRELLP